MLQLIGTYQIQCLPVAEDRSQEGLQYTRESYIHKIICRWSTVNDETIETEGKANQSQCSHRAPHALKVHVKDKHIVEQSVWSAELTVRCLCSLTLANMAQKPS